MRLTSCCVIAFGPPNNAYWRCKNWRSVLQTSFFFATTSCFSVFKSDYNTFVVLRLTPKDAGWRAKEARGAKGTTYVFLCSRA